MLYLKTYESFSSPKLKVGDMVYVDVFNFPYNRFKFEPVFDNDTRYEITYIGDGVATIFDDMNVPFDVPLNFLYSDKINEDYIRDCVYSSFDDILSIEWKDARGNDRKPRITFESHINDIRVEIQDTKSDRDIIQGIYESEFRPRLQEGGYKSEMAFTSTSYNTVFDLLITVSRV